MKTYNVYFDLVFTVEAESEEEAVDMVKIPDVHGASVQYAMTWAEDEEGMEEDESATI